MDKQSFVNRYANLEGRWFVIMAAILWGTTGTAQSFAPSGTQPMTVGAIRLFFGAIALAFLAAKRKELGEIRHWKSWFNWTTFLAAAGIALFQVFFFAGVARTGVAVGTVVGIGSTPVAAGIMVFFWHRERPDLRWVFATILAIIGCALLILTSGRIEVDPIGILLAIGAGTAYALYTLLSKELLNKLPAGTVLTITFFIGVVFLSPIFFLGDLGWLAEPKGLLVALHLGIVTVGFAYLLFAMGLITVPVAKAATLTLVEPLTAALLGVVLLGEILNGQALLGMSLIFGGLLLLEINSSPPMAETPPIAVEFSEYGNEDQVP